MQNTSCPNLKLFRLLHHYWHNVKIHKKNAEKNRGLVPTIQSEPYFSWTRKFCGALDNVELLMYMKFKDWMQRYGKKHQKYPP